MAAQTTPFRIVFGQDPPSLLTYETRSSVFMEVDQQLIERDAMLSELRQHLHRAQQRMKAQVDTKRWDITFEVGDPVLLKPRPYRQWYLARRAIEKLSPRFYGPFTILAKVGPVDYRLQLPADAKIHRVFHVSQLKKDVGSFPPLPPLPIFLDDTLHLCVEPEAVLGVRPSSTSPQSLPDVLIKWQGLPAHHDGSWESSVMIKTQFPAFHLEVKVPLQPGGNDKPPIYFTYSRRKGTNAPKGRHDKHVREYSLVSGC